MIRNPILKIFIIFYIPMCFLISMFPPFEFGTEKLNTLSERRSKSKIFEMLPIKKYDFIFGDNKKYFALDSYDFYKFIKKDNLKYYIENWRDKKLKFIASFDSFYTAKYFLYPTFTNESYSNGVREINNKLDYKDYGLVSFINKQDYVNDVPKNYFVNYDEIKNNIYPDYIKGAVNYWNVKSEYDKEPFFWNCNMFYHFDSTGKYDYYLVTQPIYYLLDRKVLVTEFLIEYIFAFFASFILSYLFFRVKFRKVKN